MNSVKKSKILYDKIYILSFILCASFLFFITARRIPLLTNIMVWDEIGYWSNAAYLAGYDWSSVASAFANYYSFGYSLLIAPILFWCQSGSIAYQVAILMNCFFVVGNFVVLVYLGNILTNNNRKYEVVCCALIAGSYTNILAQSTNAWPECELTFLCTFIISLFFGLEKKYSFSKVFLISLLLVYLYCVHNRTMAFIIAGMIILSLGILLKKIPLKHTMLCSIFVVVFGVGFFKVKELIREGVYLDENVLGNNASVVLSAAKVNFLNLLGLIDIAQTFSNRFFYWGLTTFGSFFVVCFYYINHLRNVFRKKEAISLGQAYFALATFGTICLLTLSLTNHHDYQSLLYGRYQDMLACPLYMVGLLILLNPSKTNKKWIPCSILLLFLMCKVAKSLPIYKDYFVINCNPVLYKYWIGTDNGGYDFAVAVKNAVVGFLVFYFISGISNYSMKIKVLCGATAICCSISIKDSTDIFESVYTNYYGLTEEIAQIHNLCADYESIYFVKDSDISMTQPIAMWIQLEMYDHRIIVVGPETNIESDSYIIYPRKKRGDMYLTNVVPQGDYIMGSSYIGVYYKGD